MSQLISQARLRQLVDTWIGAGRRVIGPRRVASDLVLYQDLTAADALVLEGFVHPANTIKEAVFPRHEPLYAYRRAGKRVELDDVETPIQEQVVVAARPCDAAAFPILDHIFNWDYADELYNARRRRTTVVVLACRAPDAHCFCTSVGGGLDDPRGADAMLFDLGDGTFEVRPRSDSGKTLFEGRTEQSARVAELPPRPDDGPDLHAVRAALAHAYDLPLWETETLACLGCGACAYNCPTCHCFDIVDERRGDAGQRVRNWDACQFAMFTMHASGHNPRPSQSQKQRQRLGHKFKIYPDKFGETLCTGCGNCARNCPAGLGVRPLLDSLAAAGQASQANHE